MVPSMLIFVPKKIEITNVERKKPRNGCSNFSRAQAHAAQLKTRFNSYVIVLLFFSRCACQTAANRTELLVTRDFSSMQLTLFFGFGHLAISISLYLCLIVQTNGSLTIFHAEIIQNRTSEHLNINHIVHSKPFYRPRLVVY